MLTPLLGLVVGLVFYKGPIRLYSLAIYAQNGGIEPHCQPSFLQKSYVGKKHLNVARLKAVTDQEDWKWNEVE